MNTPFSLIQVGVIRSALKDRKDAPLQGNEGSIEAWLEVDPKFQDALRGIEVGHELIIISWLHEAARDRLQVHPRGDSRNPLTGVFATRSPHRPNPLGLHRVSVLELDALRLRVGPIEAIDGTPVVDVKPVLPVGDS